MVIGKIALPKKIQELLHHCLSRYIINKKKYNIISLKNNEEQIRK